MVRPIVVLPQPDSPTRPSVSPGTIEKVTSSTAFTVAVFDENRPPALIFKCLERRATAGRGWAAAAGVAVSGAAGPVAARGAGATSVPAAISSARQQAER